jgi:HSP20 family protein
MTVRTKTKGAEAVPLVQNFREQDATAGTSELHYPINIIEKKGKYQFHVAVPGFRKRDFKVSAAGSLLTISAVSEDGEAVRPEDFTRREFSRPSFTRGFIMPEDVEADRIKTRYRNGMLLVTLKKNDRYQAGKKNIKVD